MLLELLTDMIGIPREEGLNIAKLSYAATYGVRRLKQAILLGFGGYTLPKMMSGTI